MKTSQTNGLPADSGSTCPCAGESRRAFVRDCVRYPVLAGLAVLGGWLALKKSDPSLAEPCVMSRVCRGCKLFDNCSLPQAAATRNQS